MAEVKLDALRDQPRADALMRDAIRALVQWQSKVPADALPAFTDALLERDLALFPEWCVQREFGVGWTLAQQETWQRVCRQLVASAQAQPAMRRLLSSRWSVFMGEENLASAVRCNPFYETGRFKLSECQSCSNWSVDRMGLCPACTAQSAAIGARLPVTALIDQFYAQIVARGGKRWDTSSLINLLAHD